MSKFLSINIINKVRKDYKKKLLKDIKVISKKKERKPQCGREHYKILSEDEKNRRFEYRKNCVIILHSYSVIQDTNQLFFKKYTYQTRSFQLIPRTEQYHKRTFQQFKKS